MTYLALTPTTPSDAQTSAPPPEPAPPLPATLDAKIEIEREEDGRIIAEIPDLPGALAYGKDEAEARRKAIAVARDGTALCDKCYQLPKCWRAQRCLYFGIPWKRL